MDIKDFLKLHVITQLGSQSAAPRSASHVFQQVIVMGLVSLLDDVLRVIPRIFECVKTSVASYFKREVEKGIQSVRKETLGDVAVGLHTKHFENRVLLTRVFRNKNGDASGGSGGGSGSDTNSGSEITNDMVDAVLTQISRLTNVPSFQLIDRGQVMITYKDKPIQMSRDVFFKIKNIDISADGVVLSVMFELLSNNLSACDIVKYVSTLYANYINEIKNSLGDNIYFFEQKHRDGPPPPPPPNNDEATLLNHKRMLINTAPKQLSFTYTPFYSNKKFSNVFGKEARLVEKRVRFFMDNKAWYDAKGIPYQLGVLLSGVPGAGKSSCIKAIANLTKRHIINVNFANISTATQLKQLFYNERIQVYTDNTMSNTQSLFIPIDQRIYVLEEIDAIGDIVKERSLLCNENASKTVPDELTLMEILTILDGTMEIPGRIVVMTTNRPEVLDKALIRPGRIDVQVCFGNASRDMIKEMFESFMDMTFPDDKLEMLPSEILSPAEVGQVIFRHFDSRDVDEFVKDINEVVNKTKVSVATKEARQEEVKVANDPKTIEMSQDDDSKTSEISQDNVQASDKQTDQITKRWLGNDPGVLEESPMFAMDCDGGFACVPQDTNEFKEDNDIVKTYAVLMEQVRTSIAHGGH